MEGPAIGANEEKEENDKEFEERLYRLDEVELRHSEATRLSRKVSLCEVQGENEKSADEFSLVPDGLRVIGSVYGVEAASVGFIDCVLTEMLVNSGAEASVIDYKVLKRIGHADEPLQPYDHKLNSVTGHKLKIRGIIDLPVRLGSQERIRPFGVVDRLYVDVILVTDTLTAYRAVFDPNENAFILKDTDEVFPLGTPRIEELHQSKISSTIRL
ncbi:hypothetical protein Pcac1_g23742 [Phytophthora cactorum]|nr:hypothetical protein Pcac1_g23742 [Phytophthora cactorum]